jgi:hypothetical protein
MSDQFKHMMETSKFLLEKYTESEHDLGTAVLGMKYAAGMLLKERPEDAKRIQNQFARMMFAVADFDENFATHAFEVAKILEERAADWVKEDNEQEK